MFTVPVCITCSFHGHRVIGLK